MSEIKLIDIGSAPVDSGQLFITDPCYIDNYKQGDGNLHIQVETKEYLDDPTIKEKNFYKNNLKLVVCLKKSIKMR